MSLEVIEAEQALEPASLAPNLAQGLMEPLGITRTLAEVLVRRGFTEPQAARRYLEPKLADLTHPEKMVDREVLAARLARAVRERERVVVFGDYDCDGITSTAILTDLIRQLGGVATPILASRFDGGYGVSERAAQRILAAKPAVLVTCDCGSSDHVSLRKIAEAGVDVLVIDHHLVPDEPLPALAFINPHRPDCGFEYKGLASCGLVLSIGAALRASLNAKLDLREYLDLVAIGTVADVAPLDGDNRALVRAGLEVLRQAKRPGLRALFEYAKLDLSAPLTGEDIAFRIAPRINAAGRLGSPEPALDLLLARNLETARSLAARLEQITDERKAQQRNMEQEAIEQIEAEGFGGAPGIVVGAEGWNHGVVGIVAGRLVERYQVPVVVFGFVHGIGHGSVRGPAGARLYDALCQAADLVERFGGHQAAAGVTLRAEQLTAFRERFVAACNMPKEINEPPREEAEAVALDAADEPFRVACDLERLEPCGEKNPSPKLRLDATLISSREVGSGHLKLELELPGARRVSAFGINQGSLSKQLSKQVSAIGRLKRDTYRGGEAVELRLDQVFNR